MDSNIKMRPPAQSDSMKETPPPCNFVYESCDHNLFIGQWIRQLERRNFVAFGTVAC
jgi:hypothetical protein